MAGGRPGGWSRFTRLHRDVEEAPETDPFPALGAPKDRSRLVVQSGAQQQSGSFAAAARKGIHFSSVEEDEVGSLEAQVYGRLQEMGIRKKAAGSEVGTAWELKSAYAWAEATLVDDVVTAVEGDREMAAACLDSMAPPTTTSDAADDTASQQRTAPAQPGSEGDGDDPYMKYRREAVQATRARQKLGRRAVNAYFAGDHNTAKSLSRQARERRVVAEELNAKAADAILRERNPEGEAHVWVLDLHGLHAPEAVQAVHNRLAEIESKIGKDPVSGFSAAVASAAGDSGPIRVAARVPSQMQLKIITGVGTHSRGGASIPSAVKNYLLVNEYRFTEPWDGVLTVHPKRARLIHTSLTPFTPTVGNVPIESSWEQSLNQVG